MTLQASSGCTQFVSQHITQYRNVMRSTASKYEQVPDAVAMADTGID